MDRRAAIATGAIALGGAMLPAPLAALDEDRQSDLDRFLRMRSSEYGRRTFWWYTGMLYGDRYGEPMRPLFRMRGASQTMASRHPEGGIAYSLKEAGYYCDLDTAEVIEHEAVNPFTGEMIRPSHYLSSQELRFSPGMTVRPEAELPAHIEFDGRITGPDIKGSRIWMSEYLFVTVRPGDGAPPRISNSMATFEASLEDVSRAGGFVPATMQYTTFNSYRTWMNMGATRGHVMMRLNALKLDAWSEVPESIRSRIDTDHAGEFGDA